MNIIFHFSNKNEFKTCFEGFRNGKAVRAVANSINLCIRCCIVRGQNCAKQGTIIGNTNFNGF